MNSECLFSFIFQFECPIFNVSLRIGVLVLQMSIGFCVAIANMFGPIIEFPELLTYVTLQFLGENLRNICF